MLCSSIIYDSWHNIWSDHQQKVGRKQHLTLTLGRLGIFKAQLREIIHTHVYTGHTSCGSEIFVHWSSCKCSKFTTTSHTASSVTPSNVMLSRCCWVSSPMYRGEWRRNRQEHHQLQTLILDNNTLLELNANSCYSLLMGQWIRMGSTAKKKLWEAWAQMCWRWWEGVQYCMVAYHWPCRPDLCL